jgi:hypothetical protein
MKTNSSIIGPVMMAGMFFFAALSAKAGHDSGLLGQVRAMDVSSDHLLTEYRKELRESHCRPSKDELRLLQEISNLETLTDRVRSAIENGESGSCVSGWLHKVRSSYNCTRSFADKVGVCRCTRGYLSAFSTQLCQAERALSSSRSRDRGSFDDDHHRFGIKPSLGQLHELTDRLVRR